jgi:hypothetical protein
MAFTGAVPATLIRPRRQAYGSSYAGPAALSAENVINANRIVSTESQEMRCLHCKNLNLKDYPAHAKVNLGRCMAVDVYRRGVVFMPLHTDTECDQYRAATEEVIQKRKEWHESRKGR